MIGILFPHDDDSDANECEGKQGSYAGQITGNISGQKGGDQSYKNKKQNI